MCRANWILMIELNQNYRAMYSVVEDRVIFSIANPRKLGVIDMLPNFIHGDIGVRLAKVSHIDTYQV